ncbi:MAG TPA: hypothetical protein VMZ69_10070, partial [Saprospiraceae bacterium]|nr:hypothetical protein [Saprospiraceae bacterium]
TLHITAILVVLSMTFTSCRKYGCDSEYIFSGITERDESGKLLKNDGTDWTLKDKWGDQEKALFDQTYKTTCFPPSHFTISAHPNPNKGQFQLNFSKTDATYLDVRLVDSDCNVISSHDRISANGIGLGVKAEVKSKIFRVYYRFVEDGCEYQGHGDIMVKK